MAGESGKDDAVVLLRKEVSDAVVLNEPEASGRWVLKGKGHRTAPSVEE